LWHKFYLCLLAYLPLWSLNCALSFACVPTSGISLGATTRRADRYVSGSYDCIRDNHDHRNSRSFGSREELSSWSGSLRKIKPAMIHEATSAWGAAFRVADSGYSGVNFANPSIDPPADLWLLSRCAWPESTTLWPQSRRVITAISHFRFFFRDRVPTPGHLRKNGLRLKVRFAEKFFTTKAGEGEMAKGLNDSSRSDGRSPDRIDRAIRVHCGRPSSGNASCILGRTNRSSAPAWRDIALKKRFTWTDSLYKRQHRG
jgi:hypothetical protein